MNQNIQKNQPAQTVVSETSGGNPKNAPASTFTIPTGEIKYPLTNDYMFRAVLQRNEAVLRGLLASLLSMDPGEIRSVQIENPIKLGESIKAKTVILDILLTLNNNSRVNIEMQVTNEHNWQERSLTYLSRMFNNLNRDDNYRDVKPAIHIGILDFDLFPGEDTFYSKNVFMDRKTFRVFSGKMQLNVLSLNKIDQATEEDKACGLDHWARLFRATTWEELRRLAGNNEVLNGMIVTMAKLSEDDKIRMQCEAREIYNRRERTWQVTLEEETARADKAEQQLKNEKARADNAEAEIASLQKRLRELQK